MNILHDVYRFVFSCVLFIMLYSIPLNIYADIDEDIKRAAEEKINKWTQEFTKYVEDAKNHAGNAGKIARDAPYNDAKKWAEKADNIAMQSIYLIPKIKAVEPKNWRDAQKARDDAKKAAEEALAACRNARDAAMKAWKEDPNNWIRGISIYLEAIVHDIKIECPPSTGPYKIWFFLNKVDSGYTRNTNAATYAINKTFQKGATLEFQVYDWGVTYSNHLVSGLFTLDENLQIPVVITDPKTAVKATISITKVYSKPGDPVMKPCPKSVEDCCR